MVNNLELQRFEMHDGEPMVAFLQYRLRSTVLDLLHTETLPAHEGSGYGSELVRGALDYARERGWQVVPSCPFVRSYLAEHPQYRDLVPGEERTRYGLDADD